MRYDGTQLNVVSNVIKQTGNVVIEGNSLTANVNNVRILDPIVTLANDPAAVPGDARDRGIEFKYPSTSTSQALGWFGYKSDTKRFTFIPNAVNNGEIVSGSVGNMEVNTLFSKDIVLQSAGNLDLTCGTVSRVSKIQGCSGDLTLSGTSNVFVQASSNIALSAGSSVILNSTVPLLFGNSSNSIQNDTAGNLLLYSGNDIILNSNVQIRGTMQSVFSTVTRIEDPIITIGGVTGPILDDNKDRGIEFKWYQNNQGLTGFFGFDDSTGRFTFIPNGTNIEEVFFGDRGDVEFRDVYARDGNYRNLNLQDSLYMQDGRIQGNTLTFVTTQGDILMSPTTGASVIVPFETKIAFGDTSNSILSSSDGNLQLVGGMEITMSSPMDITLVSDTGVVLENGKLYFSSDKQSQLSISSELGESVFSSPESITLNTKDVYLPNGSGLQWGTEGTEGTDGPKLLAVDDALTLSADTQFTIQSPLTNIQGDTNVLGSISAESIDVDNYPFIHPLGSYQVLYIESIVNGQDTDRLIVTTELLHGLKAGDKVRIKATNSVPVVDGEYVISFVSSATSFVISRAHIQVPATSGRVRSVLVEDPGKDVGIQVNWHTGTAGTDAFKTGFFGFKRDTERFTVYKEGTNIDDVFTGTLGNIELNKAFLSRTSGFALDGGLTAGSHVVSGTNFDIQGGKINATTIGQSTPSTAQFTHVTTGSMTTTSGTLHGNFHYSFERLALDANVLMKDVSNACIVSFVSVNAAVDGAGELPVGLQDGQLKVIVFSHVAIDGTYTLTFPAGRVMFPNPCNESSTATSIKFKRRGQSISLIWDAIAQFWVPVGGNGGYVQ
jgi:hypothetical protein